MSIPEEALKTISVLVLNWQRTIVFTAIGILATLFLSPIALAVFLLGQQTGKIPSQQEFSHTQLLAKQEVQRVNYLSLAEDLKRMSSEVTLNRQVMAALSEDIVDLMRQNCINTSQDQVARTNCLKPRWMRQLERKQEESKRP